MEALLKEHRPHAARVKACNCTILALDTKMVTAVSYCETKIAAGRQNFFIQNSKQTLDYNCANMFGWV